jgi:hypothetical protein
VRHLFSIVSSSAKSTRTRQSSVRLQGAWAISQTVAFCADRQAKEISAPSRHRARSVTGPGNAYVVVHATQLRP